MSSKGSALKKTPVGSPSARRLTRSNEKPAETRDLRKRSKTGAGSKNPPGRRKRIKTDEASNTTSETFDEDDGSTDVDPNSDTDHVTTDDDRNVEPSTSRSKKKKSELSPIQKKGRQLMPRKKK